MHHLFHFITNRFNLVLTFGFIFWVACQPGQKSKYPFQEEETNRSAPHDWMMVQRAYPQGQADLNAHRQAVQVWQDHRRALVTRSADLTWQSSGPTNIGGRVTDIEMPASSKRTIYVAAASGGIFKSEDTGQTWQSVFDDYGVLAIGDMAMHPKESSTIYAGTGEPNAGGGSVTYEGNGIYRSRDGGQSWQHLGLENSGSVGRIMIDPFRPERLFVAAMGSMFAPNTQRGIFRSLNGGQQWERVLYVSSYTGGIDIAIHPQHPDTIYAALWERVRRADYRSYGGSTTGLYRSADGGSTWQELTAGLPQLAHEKGRIGLAIAPSQPWIVYAVYATQSGNIQGIYRSGNGGETWTALGLAGIADPGFMWWFGRIWVHPQRPNKVYVAGLDLYTSENHMSWNIVFRDTHVDHHALFFHPQDPSFMLNGNDGGVYLSQDGGLNHQFLPGLPITQFYTVHADRSVSGRIYGGTQDNASMRTSGAPHAWEIIWVGDGFATFSDPTNANLIYTTSQYGYFARSVNGGKQFFLATMGISSSDRRNWNTPVMLDPAKPFTLYFGTNRMYRSSDRAQNWFAISGDLTDDQRSPVTYNTITTIDISPFNSDRIYCGTDDGRVWITSGNNQWTEISRGLPKRWVTRVVADPRDYQTLLVTLSGYRWGESISHVYKSSNNGESWTSIGDPLPDVPVNDLVVIKSLDWLVVATDAGIYYSANEGASWHPLGQGLPPVVVNDLDYREATQILYAGTYGRSIMQLNLADFTTTSTHEAISWQARLYPNPATENLWLNLQDNPPRKGAIQVYDTGGHLVWNHNLSAQDNYHIPLQGLVPGPYVLLLRTDRGQKVLKFLKR